MSVYIDTARNKFGRMIMCHMIADTPNELHDMAFSIGMKRDWFQLLSFPHYDLSLSRKKMAMERGAIILERREFVKRKKEIGKLILDGEEKWNDNI